jgi:uncharacterized membrane protein YjjP (DUF1212 family)
VKVTHFVPLFSVVVVGVFVGISSVAFFVLVGLAGMGEVIAAGDVLNALPFFKLLLSVDWEGQHSLNEKTVRRYLVLERVIR